MALGPAELEQWSSIGSLCGAGLILGFLAAALSILGVVSVWVSRHPEEIRALLHAAYNQPWLEPLRKRYRREIAFLVRRFRPEGAFGLSFTAGLAALVASTCLFGVILEDVLARDEIAVFDAPIVRFVAENRVAWLTFVMKGVSQLGRAEFIIILTVAAGLYFHQRTGQWRPLLLLLAAAGGAGVLDLIAKLVIAQPRPPAVWMVVPATGYAFPSGHTTLSAVYFTLAHFSARVRHTWRAKVFIYTVAVAIAFLIGVSRVYLGAHWPTDVVGGWALAVAWLAILLLTTSTIEASGLRSRNKKG